MYIYNSIHIYMNKPSCKYTHTYIRICIDVHSTHTHIQNTRRLQLRHKGLIQSANHNPSHLSLRMRAPHILNRSHHLTRLQPASPRGPRTQS